MAIGATGIARCREPQSAIRGPGRRLGALAYEALERRSVAVCSITMDAPQGDSAFVEADFAPPIRIHVSTPQQSRATRPSRSPRKVIRDPNASETNSDRVSMQQAHDGCMTYSTLDTRSHARKVRQNSTFDA